MTFKVLLHTYTLDWIPNSSAVVVQPCRTLDDPMYCSTPGFSVLHYLPEFAETRVHGVGDAVQPSYLLSSLSCLALTLSQHQGLFQ